jgi:hypothetical protein
MVFGVEASRPKLSTYSSTTPTWAIRTFPSARASEVPWKPRTIPIGGLLGRDATRETFTAPSEKAPR